MPQSDPLYQSNREFWCGFEIYKNLGNLAWNTGSGYVLRRDALHDISGFPTHCLIEDVQSSMSMMAKGWKTAYISEALQYGLVPNTYFAHLKQYVRWVSICNYYLSRCAFANILWANFVCKLLASWWLPTWLLLSILPIKEQDRASHHKSEDCLTYLFHTDTILAFIYHF